MHGMCGRFTLRTPTPVLARTFHVSVVPELSSRFNIAPTQDIPVVRQERESYERELDLMRWGLVPSWAPDLSIGNRMINARSETVASKPSFRTAFQRRRCLIVADGYYEWKKIGKTKQPYHIRMATDSPFAMAGLWEAWRGGKSAAATSSGSPVLSCTILTTESNDLTSDVHDRMPVILAEPDWDVWLQPEQQDASSLLPLLTPYPSDEMQMQPVSTYVNNARHEGPACLEVQPELF